jgi:hypothetical protein
MQNFEDFPDQSQSTSITMILSRVSCNPVPTSRRSKLSASLSSVGRNLTRLSPLGKSRTQTSSPATSRTHNLDQDVKPRGGNAYSTRNGGKGKSKGKGRGKGKGKGKDHGKGRSLADNGEFEQPLKQPRLHKRQAQTVEYIDPPADSDDTLESDTRLQTSHRPQQSSSNRTVLRVHGTNTPKD